MSLIGQNHNHSKHSPFTNLPAHMGSFKCPQTDIRNDFGVCAVHLNKIEIHLSKAGGEV